MPTVLTATPPVRFTIARLRQAVAETSRFTDEDLRGYINEGYKQACERADFLQSIATLTIAPGTQEATLPADWFRTLDAFDAGVRLEAAPIAHSGLGLRNTYFQHGRTFGMGLAPANGAAVTLLYVQTPADLGYDDFPLWGREHDPILRSYAAWRCVLASGGAQAIRKGQTLRQEFHIGVRDLRRSSISAPATSERKRTIQDTREAPIAG